MSDCEDCGNAIPSDAKAHIVYSELPPIEVREGLGYWETKTRKTFDERLICDACFVQTEALKQFVLDNLETALRGDSDHLQAVMGLIRYRNYSEGEAIAVGEEYLSEFLEQWEDQNVYAVFGFADTALTPQVMAQVAIEMASGTVDAKLSAAYSEITGFLWVNEEGGIGGHDMIAIFSRNEGKYGCLVVSPDPISLGDFLTEVPVGLRHQ